MPLSMVHEELGVADTGALAPSWVAEAAFAALLLLFYVEFTPFLPRDAASMAARDTTSLGGDLLRQASFVGVFLVIAGYSIARRGLSILTVVPIPLVLLLAWCVASTAWSAEPDITFRRSVLQVVLVWSMMLGVDLLGTERSLAIWRYVLLAVVAADFVSVALVREAVHLPTDVETKLAGDWRGVHSHKNLAGAVCANAAIVFLFWWLEGRKRWQLVACAAAVIFLIMTGSKTSMTLLPVSLGIGALYRLAMKSTLDRSILFVAAVLVVLIGGTIVALEWDTIAQFLQDPQNITGRAEIWGAELRYVRDHPVFGSGFGLFANPGARSPIFYYVGTSWLTVIGEGHNAYLELLLTIGGVGLALMLTAVVIVPFYLFFRQDAVPLVFKQFLFTLFVFLCIHNFIESDFLNNAVSTWGEMLAMLALLTTAGREARAAQPAKTWPW